MELHLEGDWYVESYAGGEIHGHRVLSRVAREVTSYQTVEIVDTEDYGRALFLDGLVQSTEADEFIYHETLIHPGLILHPRPGRVLIAGGGEGAPLREALKHPSVKDLVMVEIDPDMVRMAKAYLEAWHRGAFDDERVRLVHEDARNYLASRDERYDAIFLDLCDPGEEGPAQSLFTVEFYRLVKQRLSEGGLAVIQGGSANANMQKTFSTVYHTLRAVFEGVVPYLTCVPSFVGLWAFFLVSAKQDSLIPAASLLEQRFAERGLASKVKFYDPQIHASLFTLPRYFKELLSEGRPAFERDPLTIHREKV